MCPVSQDTNNSEFLWFIIFMEACVIAQIRCDFGTPLYLENKSSARQCVAIEASYKENVNILIWLVGQTLIQSSKSSDSSLHLQRAKLKQNLNDVRLSFEYRVSKLKQDCFSLKRQSIRKLCLLESFNDCTVQGKRGLPSGKWKPGSTDGNLAIFNCEHNGVMSGISDSGQNGVRLVLL